MFFQTMDFQFTVDKNKQQIIKPFQPKKDRITTGNDKIYIPIPRKKLSVKWKGKIVAGPNNKRVYGITDQIIQRLQYETTCGYNEFNMKSVGIKVDRELKRFAKDYIGFQFLSTPEAKQIIRTLARQNITLVTSSILVSNFQLKHVRNEIFSGTEIDLIGYDHLLRKYVVIEVKITSSEIQSLIENDSRASIDELSTFKKSFIGMCKAQLACTTLMFQNTYFGTCYPLLVVCEKDGICKLFQLENSFLNSKLFSGLVRGY